MTAVCVWCRRAPMPPEVQTYFASLDFTILDVYGMSESTGATTAALLASA